MFLNSETLEFRNMKLLRRRRAICAPSPVHGAHAARACKRFRLIQLRFIFIFDWFSFCSSDKMISIGRLVEVTQALAALALLRFGDSGAAALHGWFPMTAKH